MADVTNRMFATEAAPYRHQLSHGAPGRQDQRRRSIRFWKEDHLDRLVKPACTTESQWLASSDIRTTKDGVTVTIHAPHAADAGTRLSLTH
jgi:hypothetical protein